LESLAREVGVGTGTLQRWRALTAATRLDEVFTTAALAEPEVALDSSRSPRHDKKHIKELERRLLRKDRSLAGTAALLVLSKKSR